MANTDSTFNEAKQLYLEKYGDTIVTNTYLKIALVLLALVGFGLVVLKVKTVNTFRDWRPLVIRVDELGRAQAVDYRSLEYHPATPRPSTSCRSFAASITGATATRSTMTSRRRSIFWTVSWPTTSSSSTDKPARSTNSSPIPRLPRSISTSKRSPLTPWRSLPITLRWTSTGSNTPRRDRSLLKTLYTASFLYIFRERVANGLIPVNPLGVTITYLREDQAFTDTVNGGAQ